MYTWSWTIFFVLSSTYNKDNCLLALQISNKRVLPNSHHPKLCLSKNNLIQRCNPPADKTLPLAQLSNYFEHAFMEIKSCSGVFKYEIFQIGFPNKSLTNIKLCSSSFIQPHILFHFFYLAFCPYTRSNKHVTALSFY